FDRTLPQGTGGSGPRAAAEWQMARGGPHRGGGGYRVFIYPPPKSFIPGSISMILGSEFFLFFSLIFYPAPISLPYYM
ncbi:uncharacterized protein BDW43DRAFT_295747, partial [Aspergillus alliaceus]|uniref:uncharacterized protein n=1 Tax=Petromyces alliaceus TaxID=209559 RepID=UPI0012A69D7D